MPEENDQRAAPSIAASSVVPQSRALSATAEVAAQLGADSLLASTGPLSELKALERKFVTAEVRHNLIAKVAKKGKGVVFEAGTVRRTGTEGRSDVVN